MTDQGTCATVESIDDDRFIGITPSGHSLNLDTNSDRRSAPSPMELLLVALGSCTAVDVIEILRKKREQVTGYRAEITGTRRVEHPRAYNQMRVHHIVKGRNVSPRSVAHAIELSETKYCSVAATLRPTVEILSTFETIEEEATGEGAKEE